MLNHSRVLLAPTVSNAKYPSVTPFPPRKIYFATGLNKKTSQSQLIQLGNTILLTLTSKRKCFDLGNLKKNWIN